MTVFYAWVAAMAAFFVAMVVVLGQPPRHCAYFVPVKGHPGIYSCSEHPYPVSGPRP